MFVLPNCGAELQLMVVLEEASGEWDHRERHELHGI